MDRRATLGAVEFWRNEVIEPALDEDTERQISAQREWIAAEPANPRPYYHLACLYRMQGKRDEPLGLLLEAVRLCPSLTDAHVALAEIYIVRADYRAAWRYARLAEDGGRTEPATMLRRYGITEE
jgi:cytochrome c-type biogenesis protein CcmH/NrfG